MTFVLVVDARAGGVLTHEGRGKSFEHSFDLRRFAWEAECERVGPQGCEHVPALELVEVAWKLRGERLAKLVVVPEAGAEELRAKRVAALVHDRGHFGCCHPAALGFGDQRFWGRARAQLQTTSRSVLPDAGLYDAFADRSALWLALGY